MLSIFFLAEIRRLRRQLRRTKKQALATGTVSNVLIQWKTYHKFCEKFERHEWPTSTETLCLFAQHLAKKFRSVDSIEHYLQGVKKLHLYAGEQPPDLKSFHLQLTIKGLRRTLRHRIRQAKPITPEILLAINKTLDMSDSTNVVLWAAFLTAFFLLLRKSNIVPLNRHSFDPGKQLSRGQIKVSDKHVRVKIDWSKTIQFRERSVSFKMRRIKNSPLCPVKAFKQMLRRVPANKSAPCFVCADGLPLSYNMFNYRLKKALKQCGKKYKRFSAHSFRHGGLTWGYKMGVERKMLQAMGDWKSSCFERYLAFSKELRYGAHKKFVKGLQLLHLN